MTEQGTTGHTFSLIELMIVLIIMGLLTALVTPAAMKWKRDADVKAAKSQVRLLHGAVRGYELDTDGLPPSLDALIRDPGNDRWNGPYLDPPKVPRDPWRNDYQYQVPGPEGLDFLIVCYGADGSPGGEKYNADIDFLAD